MPYVRVSSFNCQIILAANLASQVTSSFRKYERFDIKLHVSFHISHLQFSKIAVNQSFDTDESTLVCDGRLYAAIYSSAIFVTIISHDTE